MQIFSYQIKINITITRCRRMFIMTCIWKWKIWIKRPLTGNCGLRRINTSCVNKSLFIFIYFWRWYSNCPTAVWEFTSEHILSCSFSTVSRAMKWKKKEEKSYFIDRTGDITTSSRAFIIHCSASLVILYSSRLRGLIIFFEFHFYGRVKFICRWCIWLNLIVSNSFEGDEFFAADQ